MIKYSVDLESEICWRVVVRVDTKTMATIVKGIAGMLSRRFIKIRIPGNPARLD